MTVVAPAAWRGAFGVATLAVLGTLAALQALPYSVTTQFVSDSLQLGIVAVAAWFTIGAARRASGEARWFWAGVSASLVIWDAGQVRYMTLGSAFFDGIDHLQNVLFLTMALPLLPALALRPDTRQPTRTLLALDIAIVSVLAAFVYLYIGLSFPVSGDAAAYPRWRIGASWFVAAVVTLAFVLRMREAQGPWRTVYAQLGAATALWLVGDAAVTEVMFVAQYRAGFLDLPWVLPFAWMAIIAARWQPSPPVPAQRRAGWSETRYAAFAALAAVASPSLLHLAISLIDGGGEAQEWQARTWAVLVTSLVVAALFLARQISELDAFERSERRRDELHRLSQERFSRAFHGVPLGAAILSEPAGRVLDANDRCLEIFGLTRADAIGHTVKELRLLAEPAGEPLAGRARSGTARGEPVRIQRASGEVVDVLAWFQPLEGDEPSVLVLAQDQRETRQLETRLIQAQKAEAVGRLAGSVAHDLNNLLTAIIGSTEVARERLGQPAMLRQDLEHVVQAADRAAALTARLLEYGQGQATSAQSIDLGAAVREAERTVRQLAGEGVTTELAVPPVRLQVRIDPAEFERILVNLVVNARDAMRGGGTLHVGVRPATIDASAAARHGVAPGRYVALAVRDSGEGISASLLPRVFEPYFTTKAPGQGSGLGLATVLETARRFGGGASIDSTPGAGTTVTVHLPAADDEGTPAIEAAVSRPSGTGTETVLLVEDEDAVREIVRRVLERQGYHVLEASSGPRALQIAATWTRPIDLLLTDVVMPGMNGPQLAVQLQALRPGIRVLFASGYAADALGPLKLGSGDIALIQKPFTPAELAARVRKALDEPVNP